MDGSIVGPQARELTPDEYQARVEECFAIEQRVKASLRAGRAALWEAAEALYAFDEMSAWSALDYEKLSDWLADPEISMTKATFYRLVGIWHDTVVVRQLPKTEMAELDVSKVSIVMPAVKAGKKTFDDAMDDVKVLGARDLRTIYQGQAEPEVTDTDGDLADSGSLNVETSLADNPDEPEWATDVEAEAEEQDGPESEGEAAQRATLPPLKLNEALVKAEEAIEDGSKRRLRIALEDLVAASVSDELPEVVRTAEIALQLPQRNARGQLVAAPANQVREALEDLLVVLRREGRV